MYICEGRIGLPKILHFSIFIIFVIVLIFFFSWYECCCKIHIYFFLCGSDFSIYLFTDESFMLFVVFLLFNSCLFFIFESFIVIFFLCLCVRSSEASYCIINKLFLLVSVLYWLCIRRLEAALSKREREIKKHTCSNEKSGR